MPFSIGFERELRIASENDGHLTELFWLVNASTNQNVRRVFRQFGALPRGERRNPPSFVNEYTDVQFCTQWKWRYLVQVRFLSIRPFFIVYIMESSGL